MLATMAWSAWTVSDIELDAKLARHTWNDREAMGAGASTAALVLDTECQRPLDASDVDDLAAKDEVVRLRGLLAAHVDVIRRVTGNPQQQQQTQELRRVYCDISQQTDECISGSSACDRVCQLDVDTTTESGKLSANASCSALALAPGIQEYLITCFASADLDSSGVLSAYEFARLLREHTELGLSPEDIQLLLAQTKWMDAKGDVTWQQFVQLAPQLLANLADASSSSGPRATDWCSCITAEGTPYYYNKRTQESVWDKPDELARVPTHAALEPLTLMPELQVQSVGKDKEDQGQLTVGSARSATANTATPAAASRLTRPQSG